MAHEYQYKSEIQISFNKHRIDPKSSSHCFSLDWGILIPSSQENQPLY